MKRLAVLVIVMGMLSCGDDDSHECIDIPCPRPNINDVIELTLSVENAAPGDQAGLIRINRSDKRLLTL